MKRVLVTAGCGFIGSAHRAERRRVGHGVEIGDRDLEVVHQRSIDDPLPFMRDASSMLAVPRTLVRDRYVDLNGPDQHQFRFVHVSTDEAFGSSPTAASSTNTRGVAGRSIASGSNRRPSKSGLPAARGVA